MNRVIVTLLALLLSVNAVFSQDGWKYAAGRNGIKVYSKTVADSKIKAMKAECVLDADVEEILALLMDVKAAEKWVCHTKSCSLIRKVSDSEMYYHTEVSLPWPLDNRDFVTHLKVLRDAHSGVVIVDAPAVPGVMPARDGVVRISHSKNQWTLKPVQGGKTHVEYTLQVDPGGHIPAHVVNMFACRAPIETFGNMRKELQSRKRRKAQMQPNHP